MLMFVFIAEIEAIHILRFKVDLYFILKSSEEEFLKIHGHFLFNFEKYE